MDEYEVTVTVTLVYTTKAKSADAAEHEARVLSDAELWAKAEQTDYDYQIAPVLP